MQTSTRSGKRGPATSRETTGFTFSSAAPYADKDEYVSKKLAFTITAVAFEPGQGYEGADRWSVSVSPNDGRSVETITLQSNDKRDEQLHAAQEHITKSGSIRNVRLIKSGKAFYFETVDAAQLS